MCVCISPVLKKKKKCVCLFFRKKYGPSSKQSTPRKSEWILFQESQNHIKHLQINAADLLFLHLGYFLWFETFLQNSLFHKVQTCSTVSTIIISGICIILQNIFTHSFIYSSQRLSEMVRDSTAVSCSKWSHWDFRRVRGLFRMSQETAKSSSSFCWPLCALLKGSKSWDRTCSSVFRNFCSPCPYKNYILCHNPVPGDVGEE